jgi:hypothetical protein
MKLSRTSGCAFLLCMTTVVGLGHAFSSTMMIPSHNRHQKIMGSNNNDNHHQHNRLQMRLQKDDQNEKDVQHSKNNWLGISLAVAISLTGIFGGNPAIAADKAYDGFAEYAKENQMEQSDVGCFVQKCGDQTKNLFSNPRGIKGITCLGRCKGEQACATRCFAEFGSEDLNSWLSCTIEENE